MHEFVSHNTFLYGRYALSNIDLKSFPLDECLSLIKFDFYYHNKFPLHKHSHHTSPSSFTHSCRKWKFHRNPSTTCSFKLSTLSTHNRLESFLQFTFNEFFPFLFFCFLFDGTALAFVEGAWHLFFSVSSSAAASFFFILLSCSFPLCEHCKQQLNSLSNTAFHIELHNFFFLFFKHIHTCIQYYIIIMS